MKKINWFSRIMSWKCLKLCLLYTMLIVCLLIIYYHFIKETPKVLPSTHMGSARQYVKPKNIPFKGSKIVHLDLKGAPPKLSYYKTLFPLLSKLGATGVLIEYEDMFPYSHPNLKNISAFNAYTLEDIQYINKLAEAHKLELIPLVQTFGHLEFVLKLEDYKDMREVSPYPQVICPTHSKTLTFLLDMISEIIDAHPNSKWIHIGADEVFYLGFCDKCTNLMSTFSLSKSMLFLEHIKSITNGILKKYPQMKILMWDDEFRSFSLRDLKNGNLNEAVIPVVWKYTKEVYEDLGPSLWEVYAQVFPKVWVASAFKGATGSNQYVNDVTHYVQNHRSWMTLIAEHKDQINFEGIIITGWQRYDHFAALCELLPVSLPSLAMSLRVIMGYNDSPLSPPTEVARLLGCEQPYALIGPAFGSPKCSYEGGDILEGVLKLQQLKQEFDTIQADSRVRGWMTDFNKKYEFSNPEHIKSVGIPLGRIKTELSIVDAEITVAMYEIYDNYTIAEWKEIYLKPFEKVLYEMIETRDKILEKTVWPRRPLQGCDGCSEF